MEMIARDGVRLVYDDAGTGEPCFLFVHGWTCDRSFFAPQFVHFSQSSRVVSLDLRGHGESEKPLGDYRIAVFADDLAHLIEKLGLRKVIAVGHSMGGSIVMQLAALHPTHLSATVLVDPASFVRSESTIEEIQRLISAIETGDVELHRKFIEEHRFLPTSDKGLVSRITSVMVSTPPHVAANAMRDLLAFDAIGVARRCAVQCLHIAGTPPLNPPHLMSQWLENVVNGWTVGAGHFNQLETPDQVNLMIEAFIKHYVLAS